jgi:hypothetical protein
MAPWTDPGGNARNRAAIGPASYQLCAVDLVLMMEGEVLRNYVVYYHPLDFPDKWVVRGWSILPGGRLVPDPGATLVCDDYVDVETEMMARGLYKLVRNPEDDPCIVETWL